ncbi:GIY-YIG nuclease family protein [Aureitalea sp. L0-47]|uniref:GIY-YIG nuclease family protein n=1 Tax=Aureitalea sp. L0-47 TaxID=2816962 RepID=UPI0022373FC7|nr:GIY-YIG nuclease family protein [Aureitalea sp. L0-47]MCW5518493.1 GIY-YIG nuclease family protein [Aureitalea sp. L0-47]
MENSRIIYRVTHKESGKMYFGATGSALETRKRDHIQKGAKSTGHQFQDAIGTYGPEAFLWEQIDTANSIGELAAKEKHYIVKYNTKENGYNSDIGGGFKKPIYQYSADNCSFTGQYDCLEAAAVSVDGTRKGISAACLGKTKIYKGYRWSYSLSNPLVSGYDIRKKSIIQYDERRCFISSFSSISEAASQTGIGKSCIAKCCRRVRKTAGGFIWEFEN